MRRAWLGRKPFCRQEDRALHFWHALFLASGPPLPLVGRQYSSQVTNGGFRISLSVILAGGNDAG